MQLPLLLLAVPVTPVLGFLCPFQDPSQWNNGDREELQEDGTFGYLVAIVEIWIENILRVDPFNRSGHLSDYWAECFQAAVS
jgi:hypothetical protein